MMLASKLDQWDEEEMKCEEQDIIYRQYCCKLEDKRLEIKEYLEALKPTNCYIISRNQTYSSLPNIKVEPIYGSEYLLEPIPQKYLDLFAEAMPLEHEEIEHTRENPFMPKDKLISQK